MVVPGTHGIFEADAFDPVRGFSRHILTVKFVNFGNQVFHTAFFQLAVNELNFFGQDAVEEYPPNRGFDQAASQLPAGDHDSRRTRWSNGL